eukprot:SM004103S15628  [mRNA]  locus=s4103:253:1299:+ [translate_table: standard]
MIGMYARAGARDQAWAALHRMRVAGYSINEAAYGALARYAGSPADAAALLAAVAADAVPPGACTLRLLAAAGSAAPAEPLAVAGAGPEGGAARNAARGAGATYAGRPKEAAEALASVSAARHRRPATASATALACAYSRAGRHEEALAAFASMDLVGLQSDSVFHGALVAAHCRAGQLQAAEAVLRRDSSSAGIAAWAPLLRAHAVAGAWGDVDRLAAAMEDAGVPPDARLFDGLVA